MTKRSIDWVVMGGAIGEAAHCQRCGEGLVVLTPHDAQSVGLIRFDTLPRVGCRLSVYTAASKAFVAVHAGCDERGYREPTPTTPGEWLRSRDVGVSSATICRAAFGLPSPFGREDVPHDAADFGRCYRFIKLFPETARRAVAVLGASHPEWRRLADEWPRLESLWEAKAFDELTDRIQAITRGASQP